MCLVCTHPFRCFPPPYLFFFFFFYSLTFSVWVVGRQTLCIRVWTYLPILCHPGWSPSFSFPLCAPFFLRFSANRLLLLLRLLLLFPFPATWEISRMYPIFMSGNKTDATNYRLISILCANYTQYRHRAWKMRCYLISMTRRSTTTNLACFMMQVSKAVTDRGQLDAAYCDLSKAFDGVTHPLLLKKPLLYGVDALLVALVGSYLLNRQCYISVNNGQTSVDYNPTSGVPEGSVLGPLLCLFLLTTYPLLLRAHLSFCMLMM